MSLVEFNEWYGDKGEKLHIYRDEKWIAKHGFEAGQQSQQGEVDKLQTEIDEITKQRDSFIKAHHIYMNDVCEHKDKIDELQGRVDEVLIEMKNQLGDEDFYDMERPDYDAMLYALRNIKDILK